MSQWTHVAGIIRFDGFVKPDLGKVVSLEYCNMSDDEYEKACEECEVPMGSEDSLQHQLWTNPREGNAARYTAMIWGDLRDYNDVDEIVAYFNRIVKGQRIRQACFEVDVTECPTMIFQYNQSSKVFQKMTTKEKYGKNI